MRELKFRAWNKEEREMINPVGIIDWVNGTVTGLKPDDEEVMLETFLDEEDPLVLMQFTGLKDKNGKEIYEGDVVRGFHQYSGDGGETIAKKHEKIVEVKFAAPFHGMAGFHTWPINLDEFPVEVIGNIYETPELLEARAA